MLPRASSLEVGDGKRQRIPIMDHGRHFVVRLGQLVSRTTWFDHSRTRVNKCLGTNKWRGSWTFNAFCQVSLTSFVETTPVLKTSKVYIRDLMYLGVSFAYRGSSTFSMIGARSRYLMDLVIYAIWAHPCNHSNIMIGPTQQWTLFPRPMSDISPNNAGFDYGFGEMKGIRNSIVVDKFRVKLVWPRDRIWDK